MSLIVDVDVTDGSVQAGIGVVPLVEVLLSVVASGGTADVMAEGGAVTGRQLFWRLQRWVAWR